MSLNECGQYQDHLEIIDGVDLRPYSNVPGRKYTNAVYNSRAHQAVEARSKQPRKNFPGFKSKSR